MVQLKDWHDWLHASLTALRWGFAIHYMTIAHCMGLSGAWGQGPCWAINRADSVTEDVCGLVGLVSDISPSLLVLRGLWLVWSMVYSDLVKIMETWASVVYVQHRWHIFGLHESLQWSTSPQPVIQAGNIQYDRKAAKGVPYQQKMASNSLQWFLILVWLWHH